jgi:ElaA protein
VSTTPALKADPAAAGDLVWTWARFHALGVDNLYDALALRCRVFILEQGPYLDPDGVDRSSWHLLGRDPTGALQAYLRVVDPGIKYAEPSIGRVITAPDARGTGLGHRLTAEGIARCSAAWPGQGIRISAQLRLEGFYVQHGFGRVGEPYLEDDIPHLEMLRPSPRAERRAAPSRPGVPSGDRPKYPLDEGHQ